MKKNKKIYYVAIFCSVLLLIFGMSLHKRNEKQVIPYERFHLLLQENQIEEVTLSESATMTFIKKEDATKYITQNPRKDTLKEELLLQGIHVVEEGSSTLFSAMQSILSIAIFGGVFYFVLKGSKRQGHGMMALGVKPIEAEKLKIGFSQIAGNEEAKDQVQDIIDFIKSPEKYNRLGARMPKGVIFYGPPGTGKTLMAKAIAKEANVPFFSVSGSDFVQLYVGVGASRIREIFKEARAHQKAVIFIDEIDAVGKKRADGSSGSNEEKDQTLNALLTEMSGFKSEDGIVVIAATNRLDILDDALLRPGRFDRHIQIGYPDLKAREKIISLYLKHKPISNEISATSIAKQTVYFTGAMLENLVNEAAILAANEDAGFIGKNHITKAFYQVIAGAEKKDRSGVLESERKITAFHEAGHALITKILSPENSVTKVTIIPSTKGAGGFSMNVPKDKMYATKKDILAQIQISLAGRAAEELIFGEEYVTTGASNDIEKATMHLKNYMTTYGMDKEIGLINMAVLEHQKNISIESYSEKMNALYEQTKEILRANKAKLTALANELLEKETLEEEDIDALLSA
jgi:cell division protease FtsH